MAQSRVKAPESGPMNFSVPDKAVEVVVDSLLAYVVTLSQIFQNGALQIAGNYDNLIGFDESFLGNHKDALLSDYTVSRVLRSHSPVGHLAGSVCL